MHSLKDTCRKSKQKSDFLQMLFSFLRLSYILKWKHGKKSILHHVGLLQIHIQFPFEQPPDCQPSALSQALLLQSGGGLLYVELGTNQNSHPCPPRHRHLQTGKVCTVLAHSRGDGDGLQRHRLPGRSPVGGRQVVLHHQSAGAAESERRSEHDEDRWVTAS